MPYREIGTLMAKLRADTTLGARALEFLILTATRTSEALGARWDEIDLEQRMWTIPASRMKAGREHRVPLSARAIAILKEMAEIRHNEFVFPGTKQGRPATRNVPVEIAATIVRCRARGHASRLPLLASESGPPRQRTSRAKPPSSRLPMPSATASSALTSGAICSRSAAS